MRERKVRTVIMNQYNNFLFKRDEVELKTSDIATRDVIEHADIHYAIFKCDSSYMLLKVFDNIEEKEMYDFPKFYGTKINEAITNFAEKRNLGFVQSLAKYEFANVVGYANTKSYLYLVEVKNKNNNFYEYKDFKKKCEKSKSLVLNNAIMWIDLILEF